MPPFRKRPVVISAVRLSQKTTVHTLEGDLVGQPGDWLITGVRGEQYPCKADIFEETYEYAGDAHAFVGSDASCEECNEGRQFYLHEDRSSHA